MGVLVHEIDAISDNNLFDKPRAAARRDPSQAVRWFAVLDALALQAGFFLSVFLFSDYYDVATRNVRFGVLAMGALLWFFHTGQYQKRLPFVFEVRQVIVTLCFAMLVDGFFQFALKQDISRLWLVSGWALSGAAILLFRSMARCGLRFVGLWQVRTLLVGSGAMAEEARKALRSEHNLGYDVVMQVENIPLLYVQAGQSWRRLCDRFNADAVVIALDAAALADADEAMAGLVRSAIPFLIAPPQREVLILGMTKQYFFNRDIALMTCAGTA